MWGTLPREHAVYPDVLETLGYVVGSTRKGWGPGRLQAGGRDRKPGWTAVHELRRLSATTPGRDAVLFLVWQHRSAPPSSSGTGAKAGLVADAASGCLAFFPIRRKCAATCSTTTSKSNDSIASLATIFAALERAGELDNTIVIVTSDNGMPFPRAKATVATPACGSHSRSVGRAWLNAGVIVDAFVSLAVLRADGARRGERAAGQHAMTGRTLVSAVARPIAVGHGTTCSSNASATPMFDAAIWAIR